MMLDPDERSCQAASGKGFDDLEAGGHVDDAHPESAIGAREAVQAGVGKTVEPFDGNDVGGIHVECPGKSTSSAMARARATGSTLTTRIVALCVSAGGAAVRGLRRRRCRW